MHIKPQEIGVRWSGMFDRGDIPDNDTDTPAYRYKDLASILQRAQEFNEDESDSRGEYLSKQFEDFQEIVSRIPGSIGIFGTGHPFYATKETGAIVPIEEVNRYIETYKNTALEEARKNIGPWVCTICQTEKSLPDLKEFCKPCNKVVLRPRDIFKALPDLDFWAIADSNNPEYLSTLQSNLHRAGFFQSDVNIARSIQDTNTVMDTLARGYIPKERFPIDVHVITAENFHNALSGVRDKINLYGKNKEESLFVPISPMSLHVVWESTDKPYDFMKDYLFSFTPGKVSDLLASDIRHTDEIVRKFLDQDDIYSIVARHKKEERQLQTPDVRKILENRWR